MQIVKSLQTRKLAVLVTLSVFVFVIVFLYASRQRKIEIKNMIEAATKEEASNMLGNVNDRLIFITNDLLSTYESYPPRSQDEHLRRTMHLIEANPFLQTINYIGLDQRIEFVSPLEPNKAVIGLRIEIAAPKEALQMAASSQRPYLSMPFEIIQGKLGYSMMIPYFNNTFFEVVFKAEKVFGRNGIFRRRGDILIKIFDGSVSVFSSPEYENQLSGLSEYRVDSEGAILNRAIRLSAVPAGDMLNKSSQFWRIISTEACLKKPRVSM